MARGSLGSLVVSLAADTARFQGDLGRAASIAERRMRNIRESATRALGALTIAATAAGVALTAAVRSQLRAGDEFAKMSRQVGVSVEALSAFDFQAQLAGVSTGNLRTSLIRLAANASDAAGGVGTAQAAFSALGIQVTDATGSLRNSDQVMADVADRFAAMEDGAEKTALAVRLFGRSGAELIPMLNQGSAGMEKARKEAERLGIVWSTEAAQGAERFNDQITVMRRRLSGSIIQITSEMLPVLEGMVTSLNDSASKMDSAGKAAQSASTGLKLLLSAGTLVTSVFISLGESIGAVAAALVAVATGNFRQAVDIIKMGYEDIVDRGQRTADGLYNIWSGMAEQAGRRAAAEREAAQSSFRVLEQEQKAAEQRAEQIRRILEDADNQLKAFGLDRAGQVELQLINLGATEEQINRVRDLLTQLQALEDEAKRIEQAERNANAARDEAKSIIAATRTEAERFEAQVTRLNLLVELGAMTWEEYHDVVARLADAWDESNKKVEEMQQFAIQAARNMQSIFANYLFDPFKEGLKGMLRGFADMLRRMAAEAAAAQILKGIFGGMAGSQNALLAGIGAAFGGGKANGGPVSRGTAYLVGERGPELFMPGKSGTIIPNGGGGSITVHIDARQSDDPARLLALVPVIQNQIEQSMSMKMRRGYL